MITDTDVSQWKISPIHALDNLEAAVETERMSLRDALERAYQAGLLLGGENMISISLESVLQLYLKYMDVPQNRLTDYRWLHRNLGIRNSTSKYYTETMAVLSQLIKRS